MEITSVYGMASLNSLPMMSEWKQRKLLDT